MADLRAREAERLAAATGDPEARAAWLRERLRREEVCSRCGGYGESLMSKAIRIHVARARGGRWASSAELVPSSAPPCPACAGLALCQRIELAAYAGDAGAALAAGGGLSYDEIGRATSRDLAAWTRGLARWGAPVLVRAACAAGRVALPVWEQADAGATEGGYMLHVQNIDMTDGSAPRRALDAAEAWLAEPTEERLQAWREAWVYVPEAWLPGQDDPPHVLAQRVERAARLAGEGPVRAAVSAALCSWALA